MTPRAPPLRRRSRESRAPRRARGRRAPRGRSRRRAPPAGGCGGSRARRAPGRPRGRATSSSIRLRISSTASASRSPSTGPLAAAGEHDREHANCRRERDQAENHRSCRAARNDRPPPGNPWRTVIGYRDASLLPPTRIAYEPVTTIAVPLPACFARPALARPARAARRAARPAVAAAMPAESPTGPSAGGSSRSRAAQPREKALRRRPPRPRAGAPRNRRRRCDRPSPRSVRAPEPPLQLLEHPPRRSGPSRAASAAKSSASTSRSAKPGLADAPSRVFEGAEERRARPSSWGGYRCSRRKRAHLRGRGSALDR